MTLRYLLDTDWIINYLSGQAPVVSRLDELKESGLAISVVSLAELYEGIYYSTDPQGNERALMDFLRGVAVMGIDADTCRLFGRERGRLRAAGNIVGDFDLLIGDGTPAQSDRDDEQPPSLRATRGPSSGVSLTRL